MNVIVRKIKHWVFICNYYVQPNKTLVQAKNQIKAIENNIKTGIERFFSSVVCSLNKSREYKTFSNPSLDISLKLIL